jgi:DNA invertase Pin-like site-specific DNA recombinase
MLVGYARTSTAEQVAGFEAQVRDLEKAGAEKIFREQVSAVAHRDQLDAALDFIREGDTLVVTTLSRLARSTSDLLKITKTIEDKGAALRILDLAIDTATAQGKLLLTMIGAVATFERELMLERQREGIARAKAKGKYRGRKPTARAKADEVLVLRKQGVGASEIARQVGVGRASVYRILDGADIEPGTNI